MPRTKKRKPGNGKAASKPAKRARRDTKTTAKFYAVRRDAANETAVFDDFEEFVRYTSRHTDVICKSFKTYREAETFAHGPLPSVSVLPREKTPAAAMHGSDDGDMNVAPEDVPGPDPPEEPTYIKIYAAGCCKGQGKPDSKMGFGIFFGEESPYNTSAQAQHGVPSSQRADLIAATEALSIVSEHCIVANGGVVDLHVTSNYVKSGVDVWMKRWKMQNWKNANKGELKNNDLWRDLDSLIGALAKKKIHVQLTVRRLADDPAAFAAGRLANATTCYE